MDLALVLLAATYLLIAGRRWRVLPLGRPAFALLGAVAMVVTGVLSPDSAFAAVDVRTVSLLLGMMLIGAHLDEDGALTWVERALLGGAATGWSAMARLSLSAATLSAVLVNDTVCVLLTPLVVRWSLRRGQPLAPFLITLATSANLGSAASLVGNPQNMLIATMSGIGFQDWLVRTGPAVVLALLAHVALLWLFYGRSLAGPLPAVGAEPTGSVRRSSLVVLALVTGAFLAGVDLAVAALAGAGLLVLRRRRDPAAVFAKVDWTLLLFFATLFVVVAGGRQSALVTDLLGTAPSWIAPHGPMGHAVFAGAVVAGCNIVSNVPLVLLVGHALEGATALTWVELGFVSTVAGNLTLVGSVANLIVAEAAREHHELGFWEYLRFGALTTAVSLAVGVPVLVLWSGWLGSS